MSESSNSVQSMIQNIVTVVFRIHFYYITDRDLEQDLKQEGYLKAYELLADGNYDPNKNLRTFIYTGVRNAMTNYMYHNKKENHDNLDMVTDPLWQRYESITLNGYYLGKLYTVDEFSERSNIDDLAILKVCDKYKLFGDYRGLVYNRLNKIGLIESNNKYVELSEYDEFILSSIIGEILWNMFRS
jgi:hypothetical protein